MPPKSSATKKEASIIKITLVGEATSGKTQLGARYTDNTYTDSYISTIGVDFSLKDIRQFQLRIWDTAGEGEERFKTITTSYYRSADYVVVCCDAEKLLNEKSKQSSLDTIAQYIHEARTYVPVETPILLAVTKADLIKEEEKNIPALRTMLNQADAHITLVEPFTSAKKNVGVTELFNHIVALENKKRGVTPVKPVQKSDQPNKNETAEPFPQYDPFRQPFKYAYYNRPGHALLALLIGIALLLLCIPPIAPVALPALGLGMLVIKAVGIKAAWMIALEAAGAGIIGTALSFILFRIGGKLKLGMWFREALRYLEIGVRAVISFFTVLLPGAAAFFLGTSLMGTSLDEMKSWKAPIGAVFALAFGALRLIFLGAFFIAGGLLQGLAFIGGLFAKPIEWLDKNQIDLKQWSILKAGFQWLLTLPLIPFFFLRKVGTLLSDMAVYGWENISLLDDEFNSDDLLTNTLLGALRLTPKQTKTVENLQKNESQLSIDDKETLQVPASDKESQYQKIFAARGFWPVPIDMAQATISTYFCSPEETPGQDTSSSMAHS